jgi:signal transduction histidine kinase
MILLFDRATLVNSFDNKVRQLEEANAARERFIATVSHDLRSPLASISGFAELLREPEILRQPQQVAEMTLSIERNARRLARLTEDLLCAGQFASGHPPPLRLKAIDLRQTAEEVLNDSGRTDQVKVEGSRWVYAMADRQRVQQILTNLLDNAFKHSGSKDVSIRVRHSDEGAEIDVSDRGVGIPQDRIDQIFDPFISDFSRQSNVGLGLYVVANLVGAMNGRISVASEPDAGTTFKIILPLAVPETAFLTSATSQVD